MNAFIKGQRVNFVKDWDAKGTVTVTPAIVYSCGKVRMVLTHAETGAELGRNFRPQREGWSGELVLTTDEDAQAIAMEMAVRIRAKFIAYETAQIEKSKATGSVRNEFIEYWQKRQAVLDAVIAGTATVMAR